MDSNIIKSEWWKQDIKSIYMLIGYAIVCDENGALEINELLQVQ